MSTRSFSIKVIISVLVLVLVSSSVFAAITSDFYYSNFTKKQRELYDRIDEAVKKGETTIRDIPQDMKQAKRVFNAYLDDHPEAFWLSMGFSYTTETKGDDTIYSMVLSYTHQKSLEKDKAKLKSLTDQFHKKLQTIDGDWNKLLYIYTFLASNVTYNNEYMDQSLWSVFVDHIGVCAGFARAFQYLALQEDIPCIVLTGFQKINGRRGDTPHMWCVAQVDGKWYHFDPTWGLSEDKKNIDYSFFCRSAEMIKLTHITDNTYSVPSAKDDSRSYSNVMGRYFKTFSQSDVDKAVTNALKKGDTAFQLEFGSSSELSKATEYLVKKNGISNILASMKLKTKTYYYTSSASNNTLYLRFDL